MLDSQSLNSTFLEVIISSKAKRVFIRYVSHCTLQFNFDAWWVSINVGSKCPVSWNNSTCAFTWWVYLHCGIVETSSPAVICIICHQVLHHQLEHGTSSMGKHMLAKAHCVKLNKSTQLEVTGLHSSTVDETAFAILKRHGSRRITMVRLPRKFIFDIQLNPYWPKWQTKFPQLLATDFERSKFHHDMCTHYFVLEFFWTHIPLNDISNHKLWRSYRTLQSDLLLPSAATLCNICQGKYALTIDAIK